jgi:ribosomal protein L14E/L6E/L27E
VIDDKERDGDGAIEAKPWPMDFDKLDKGSFVSPEEIRAALPNAPAVQSKYWGLAVMSLAGMIMKAFARREPPQLVVIKIVDDGILICDDALAATVTRRRARSLHRRRLRNHKQAMDVERGKLTEQQRADHDAHVVNESRKLQAERQAARDREREPKTLSVPHKMPPVLPPKD